MLRLWRVLVLLALGVGVGMVLFSGACVAPILFKTPEILDPHNAGVLMGRIFVRGNYLLNVLAGVLVLDALVLWAVHKSGLLFFHLAGAALIGLFSFYYTPYILNAQATNTTTSPQFLAMHAQSETLFKALLVLLCLSFIWRALLRPKRGV
ncbi:DUF4149 domain-containing protein [Helicobacter ailurogastricus]|uniref:TMEM205-like domain-containing protein n=1 Tax=Helicobacter ailurogastricus TaxID=1578720 RepID=A0A0K2X4I8_9HELI|nr:DUF4149 domain-containing protein [Helicobacter ailurogastricus]CRF40890.1 hypothetical protein HAL011_06590 [Helicobacter ailurogastricus]CRF42115.1 hypothetical protein HAL013_02720 [Helicobacter ailurogastricus]CRF44029.1 hypothetical protein HAL09_05970 [Helicobacter ailurogastricus]